MISAVDRENELYSHFTLLKKEKRERERQRENSKIPFFEMRYSAGPLLNMFPILYVQVLFFLIFFLLSHSHSRDSLTAVEHYCITTNS